MEGVDTACSRTIPPPGVGWDTRSSGGMNWTGSPAGTAARLGHYEVCRKMSLPGLLSPATSVVASESKATTSPPLPTLGA